VFDWLQRSIDLCLLRWRPAATAAAMHGCRWRPPTRYSARPWHSQAWRLKYAAHRRMSWQWLQQSSESAWLVRRKWRRRLWSDCARSASIHSNTASSRSHVRQSLAGNAFTMHLYRYNVIVRHDRNQQSMYESCIRSASHSFAHKYS